MILVVFTVAVILVVIAYSLTISLNSKDYYGYISKYNYKLSNRRLAELLNGNIMSNIPNIFINSKDPTVCSTSSAIFLIKLPDNMSLTDDYELHNESTDATYDAECDKICPGLSLYSLIIRDRKKQEIFVGNKQLYEGIWCVSKRPRCNLHTTYAVMTMNNDIVCRSRFPNFFGGPEGNKIIACNNSHIYHPDNILMDNKNNCRVNPRDINMTHEDELVISTDPSSFRFVCEFGGIDSLGNKYVQHPLNRLHPMRNPCIMEIPNADEKNEFDATSGECNCSSRSYDVGNRDPSNKQTPCTSCRTIWNNNVLTIKEPCFPKESVFIEARRKLPCFTGRFESMTAPCIPLFDVKMKQYIKNKSPSPLTKSIVMPLFTGKETARGQIEDKRIPSY
ncbi:uncharacterized protein LOC123270181 [Cotesia glomerata]|uniref:uncharacterized protein LOC123270181 n=1 Tax=Cotesia glomerata TaxID=32391 RepID=UPI001D0120AF|nr:uncharacterized protein LOC123270181 [Cotesia glomerata]